MSEDNTRFITPDGWVTAYGLACGYVQKKCEGTVETTLWHEGGPCYHVRAHDFGEDRGRIFWDTFETLGKARKRFGSPNPKR